MKNDASLHKLKLIDREVEAIGHFMSNLRSITYLRSKQSIALTASFNSTYYSHSLYKIHSIGQPADMRDASENRNAEFLAGRILASLALDHLGSHSTRVDVGRLRQPLWPSGFSGSISHSKGLVAVIVLRDPSIKVGIDIEMLSLEDDGDGLNKYVLSSTEIKRLHVLSENFGSKKASIISFSAKESIYKAYSETVGGYFDFNCAVFLHPLGENKLLFQPMHDLKNSLNSDNPLIVYFSLIGNWCLTWHICPGR